MLALFLTEQLRRLPSHGVVLMALKAVDIPSSPKKTDLDLANERSYLQPFYYQSC
jgi:hypothetical protein